jgi:hypothetical protein
MPISTTKLAKPEVLSIHPGKGYCQAAEMMLGRMIASGTLPLRSMSRCSASDLVSV